LTIKQALSNARQLLVDHDIEEYNLESELLLRHTLKIDRVQLYLALEQELSNQQAETYRSLIKRRLDGEPTAYITEHREFYGLDFYVNSSVLIPRPESELLVEKALELAQERTVSTIVDIGTGCGAIAVSLALNLPHTRIYATDISADALEIALANCRTHGVTDRVCLLKGDMLSPLPEPVDLIVANLPYVRKAELPEVNTHNFEPSLALNGGTDGLDKIRRLCSRIDGKLRSGGSLLLEIGQGQSITLVSFLRRLLRAGSIEVIPDLSGIDRVVSVTQFTNQKFNCLTLKDV